MSVAFNQATRNRPEGTRPIDSPAMLINIRDYIDQLKDEPSWEKNDRNGITVFKSEGLTMVLTAFHHGAEMKDLAVNGLFVLQVVDGRITVQTQDKELSVAENEILVLHPDFKYTIVADKRSILLLSIHNKQV